MLVNGFLCNFVKEGKKNVQHLLVKKLNLKKKNYLITAYTF